MNNRTKQEFEWTSNSTQYNKIRKHYLFLKGRHYCWYCGPWSGCNSVRKKWVDNNWKNHRKYQCKERN